MNLHISSENQWENGETEITNELWKEIKIGPKKKKKEKEKSKKTGPFSTVCY